MTSALKLYEQAGSPDRATITFDTPTVIAASKRKTKVVTTFNAYLCIPRPGILAYYFTPNSYHSRALPENVVSIVAIDTMELWYRARKAAEHIKAGRVHGRELDSAFENGDSNEICAALWRLARRSPKLDDTLHKMWRGEAFDKTFTFHQLQFEKLNDKELSERAKQSRRQS